jgi:rfaE bifunctional protein nucleotidyltransferase chain/domain
MPLTRVDAAGYAIDMRLAGRKIVFTNGAFDILHVGHVRQLQYAKSLGDILIVGVNSDASVRRYKGPNRPIVPEAERAEMLEGLACVDAVVMFDEDEPKYLIEEIQPDVLVKGADWAHYVSGRETVERRGGYVALYKIVAGKSTTNLISTILQVYGAPASDKSTGEPGTTT